MATTFNLSAHRQWEDWLSMALGVMVIASPWAARQGLGSQVVVLNAVIVGLLVGVVAALELGAFRAWEEWLELAAGLYLVIAPWLLGYSHLRTLTAMHVVLGCLIGALAILELWQDRGRTSDAA